MKNKTLKREINHSQRDYIVKRKGKAIVGNQKTPKKEEAVNTVASSK
jgi:hypothetical protein